MREKVSSHIIGLLILCSILLLEACSKSDEQEEFENDALAQPKHITTTNANGKILNEDPDDWRISPMHERLMSINSGGAALPFPNPVHYNSNLTIQLYINKTDAVRAIDIRSFKFSSIAQGRQIKYISSSELTTFNNITIPARIIAEARGSSANDIYRILIYDGRQNLISYGDVKVE